MSTRRSLVALLMPAVFVLGGCAFVPKSRYDAAEAMNRSLVGQTRAQLAEIANLQTHSRYIEDQLRLTEQDLARMEQVAGLDRKRLANYERERSSYRQQLTGMRRGPFKVPQGLSARLKGLSGRFPSLQFDPMTGISKLDTDVLFNTGKADLRPETRRMLDDFARLFNSPEAQDLKIMVVGHTDDRRVAKRETRETYPDNWHLSAHRALAVAEYLSQAGVPDERLGVAGFAQHQPIQPNRSAEDRSQNRRVEIFVTGPETPVVGWTESITSVYEQAQSTGRGRR